MIGRRVLYLVPDLHGPPGGIARHARTVCRVLVDAGAELTVVALHDRNPCATTVEEMAYHACAGRRSAFAARTLVAASKSPDLVLLQHPHFSSLGLLAAHLARAPLVVFAHGTDIWDPLPTLRRWALQRADRVTCVSYVTADRAIRSNGLSPQNTHVLHHCLDPQFVPRAEPERDSSVISLLTVARIMTAEQYKGHEAVIRALPGLLKDFPSLMYDIVGDGDGRPELERLAEEMGVARAVRFHGFVSEEELASCYTNTSIFVMPSWGEGFGLAFLEAMAHGKPVIAGDRDASAEVVRHGETGFVIDPTNGVELTKAIAQLLSNPGLRRRMGARGAEVVAREFGFDTFRAQLLGQLHDVLNNARRTAHADGWGRPTRL